MADKKEAPSELMVILKEQGVTENHANELIAAFGAPFIEAGEILKDYRLDEKGNLIKTAGTIVVTSEDDVEAMKKAKADRLVLKNIRTGVERRRKELKEDSLRTGRAIDAAAKYVEMTIKPAEEYLELQEKFVEIKVKKEAAEAKAARIEQLMQYTDDISIYNLDEMGQATFETLLADLKKRHDDKVAEEAAAAKKAEEERQAEIKRQEERDRENERLKKEAEAKQKAEDRKMARINRITQLGLGWDANADAYVLADQKIEREFILNASDADFDKHFTAVKTVIDKYVADQKKAQEEAQAKQDEELRKQREAADLERQKREKLEQEQRDRDAAAAKAKRDQEEADRQALLAPDKEKLLELSRKITKFKAEELPAVKSANAQNAINAADGHLAAAITALTEWAKEL